MTEEPVPFGERLRRLREAAGLTQEQLAEQAGLSVQGVAALERGRSRRPYPHTVRALGEALGLSVEDAAQLLAAIPQRDRRDDPSADLERAPTTPLPVLAAPLIGRDGDIRTVEALLDAGTRLVTLTGPGGVGKTSLAIHLVHALGDRFPDGVTFVPLAAVDDAELVATSIVHAVRVPVSGAEPALDSLQRHLKDLRALLVLDNLEQVLDAAPDIASLLRSCDGLTLIVTSRSPLRVRGERDYPVQPLAVPALDHVPRLEDVAGAASVELFVDRAQAAAPGFSLGRENAVTVAAICRRLDGLPLAIELAAARVRVMSPLDLLARLDASLPLLADGPRDLPERQRTMTHTIDWSYSLLPEPHRALFRRLSVFRGGWTLDAAEAVGALPGDSAPGDVLTSLGALVEHSLVMFTHGADGHGRYRMLVPIREFAAAYLARSGEEARVRDAHAAHYLAWTSAARSGLEGPQQVAWLARIDPEHDNIRATASWSLTNGRAEELTALVWNVWQFWWMRGYHAESRGLMESLLARDDLALALRPWVLAAAGTMAFGQGDLPHAEAWCTESHSLFTEAGDRPQAARAALTLGLAALARANLDAAGRWLSESAATFREHDVPFWASLAISAQGMIPFRTGDFDASEALLTEGYEMARVAGDRFSRYIALYNLSRLSQARGDLRGAAARYHEGLRFSLEVGDRANVAYCLEGLASVAVAYDDPHLAARLLGKAESLFTAAGSRVYTYRPDSTLRETTVNAVRGQLDADAVEFEWREGTETTLDDLLDLTRPLVDSDRPANEPATRPEEPAPDRALRDRYGLTRREIEILRLVTEHLSIREISDRLFISPRTVTTHVTSINTKLGASSRHEAARIAAEAGLG